MLNHKRLVCAIALAAVAIAGCNRGGGSDDEIGEVEDRTMPRTLTVELAGAHQVSFSQKVDMRFVVREGRGEGASMSVASVTVLTPVDIGDGKAVNPEVALVALYEGDGSYTVEAGLGQAPTTGPTVPPPSSSGTTKSLSTVNVAVRTSTPAPAETRFGYLLEPCRIRFADRITEGSADCPALLSVHGERVSMRMSWKG